MASVPLAATDGTIVDLSTIAGVTVLYAYPRTGQAGVPVPESWDMIPGARGCTPQSCAFRDHFAELKDRGAQQVFGLSSQTTAEQVEVVQRLHLPFALLSDEGLTLTRAMQFPTFQFEGRTLLKRFTFIIIGGRVEHVFYPVFPPDRNAADVVAWLTAKAVQP